MMKSEEIIQSTYDKERLTEAYNIIEHIYEYNIGSKDTRDKELCKVLEKNLKSLSKLLDKKFIPGASL